MTPEEQRLVDEGGLDYMPLPYVSVRFIRWLLTTSASLPEERLAAIDGLDRALARHEAGCPRHQHKEHP